MRDGDLVKQNFEVF